MIHFTDADTEDEINEQYRRLLIKYDYKSGRNQKIIDEITEEYQVALSRVPIDGRNYSPFMRSLAKFEEKVTDGYRAMKQNAENEAAKKEALKNKKFTERELSELISERKKFIYETMMDKNAYQGVKRSVLYKESDFKVFMAYMGTLNKQDSAELHYLDERTEYAVFYLTGKNEKKAEAVLQKLDAQMGAYIRSIFPQVERRYQDPIFDVGLMKEYHSKAGQKLVTANQKAGNKLETRSRVRKEDIDAAKNIATKAAVLALRGLMHI